MPKQKPTTTISHRIEFQTKEREAIEMVALSITAKNATQSVANLTKGVGNLLTPVLTASTAGVAAALGILAWLELRDTTKEEIELALIKTGMTAGKQIIGITNKTVQKKAEEIREEAEENAAKHRAYRRGLNQFKNSISTSLMNFANKF